MKIWNDIGIIHKGKNNNLCFGLTERKIKAK